MIYVVQAAIGGPVKIGYTSGDGIEARLAQLQTACPWLLTVVRKIPGTAADERVLHRQFADQRLHGEWFEPVGPVLDWLASVTIRETVLPESPPLVGPLPKGHGQVFDVLMAEGGWIRLAVLARQVGRPAGVVSNLLRTLHTRYGRVLYRSIVVNGSRTTEWRVAGDAIVTLGASSGG